MAGRLRARGASERTTAAFAAVPRHRLVPRFWARRGGSKAEEFRLDGGDVAGIDVLHDVDRAVAVNRVPDAPGLTTSTASAPALLAAQADRLALEPGMTVLEIGTGPGYFAAILAELVGPAGRVVTIEIDAELAALAGERLTGCGYHHVTVLAGDGDAGAPAHGPFDRVVASVGCTDVAAAWLRQLAPGGRALVPLLHGAMHPVVEVGPGGAGGVVLLSGYVAIQGRQATSDLWPFAAAAVEPVTRQPLPDAVRPVGGRDADLAFWLALADRRAGSLPGLNDGAGSSARIDTARQAIGWAGPNGAALADELLCHVERWAVAGRPTPERFHHRFVRRGTADPGDGEWVVRRTDHDQVVRL